MYIVRTMFRIERQHRCKEKSRLPTSTFWELVKVDGMIAENSWKDIVTQNIGRRFALHCRLFTLVLLLLWFFSSYSTVTVLITAVHFWLADMQTNPFLYGIFHYWYLNSWFCFILTFLEAAVVLNCNATWEKIIKNQIFTINSLGKVILKRKSESCFAFLKKTEYK